jgi:hypothetical protein
MAKLIDMKITKAERKANEPKPCSDGDGPIYPWGLRLDLNNDTLKKLGMKDLPKVGADMIVTARACVVGVRSSERENHEDRSVELQIEKLSVERAGKTMKDALDDGVREADA